MFLVFVAPALLPVAFKFWDYLTGVVYIKDLNQAQNFWFKKDCGPQPPSAVS
jgi:hypothetical protein